MNHSIQFEPGSMWEEGDKIISNEEELTRGSFINELSNAISMGFVSLPRLARFVAAINR